MDPVTIAIMSALASLGGGALSASGSRSQAAAQGKMNKPYGQFQERKNRLIDELLASVGGGGKYGDLFKTDQAAFQTSFVDPAKSMFNNQIAPQIQQQGIASGMQRSSSMDDQLMRAGIDLDQMLNQNFMQFQNQGKDRISGTLNAILGGNAASPLTAPMTSNETMTGTASGFLKSDAFSNLLNSFGQQPDKEKYTKPGHAQTQMPQSISQQRRPSFKPPESY